MGTRFYVFFSKPTMWTRWIAGAAPHKAGDVETNPDPTTSHNRVWTFDICYKQIHVRKQIFIRCNRINTWCTSHGVSRQPHSESKDDHMTTDTPQGHRPNSKNERNPIILQFNINKIKNKLEKLKLLIHETHTDIITI